jgi:NAD-dependent deacetylase sirtuin 2
VHLFFKPSTEAKASVLNGNHSLGEVAKGLQEGKYKRIVCLAGAGISVNAGIPDFRSKAGMYALAQQWDLPDPWAVFSLDFFLQRPEPFYWLLQQYFPKEFRPTLTHSFFHLLDRKGLLLRVYTQNVDCLELLGGLDSDRLIQVHGKLCDAHCVGCHKQMPIAQVQTEVMQNGTPRCDQCQGLVKPDVVFFGEDIPMKFVRQAIVDLPRCDLLLCMGSSFQVTPFANLIEKVDDLVPRVLFNKDSAGTLEDPGPLAASGQAFRFHSPDNYRDVFAQGDCDEQILALCRQLGWEQELRGLHEQCSGVLNAATLQRLQDGQTGVVSGT